MPFAKKDEILIKNFIKLKGYNAMHLVRQFPSKCWNVGLVYKFLQKLRITGSVLTIVPAVADDEASAQLVTLILLTNWYYTKVAKREIIFAHYT